MLSAPFVSLLLFIISATSTLATEVLQTANANDVKSVCIIGSGIGGSSLAYFLRQYSADPSSPTVGDIRMFERNRVVGGRMAMVSIAGDTFEAGASILHPKNFHTLNFTKLLNLRINEPSSSSFSLGIWDGTRFNFKTLDTSSEFPLFQKLVSLVNSFRIIYRYGFSLFKMDNFVKSTVDNFLKYYSDFGSRPVFESVEKMLKWAGLYELTCRTLQEELVDAGLSPLLISELVTVITRINYGQSVSMSGLAGAVALAGSGGGLWSVEGGNWQIPAGLINHSDVTLHLDEEIDSISYLGDYYKLNSTKGNSYTCQVTVVATPLDELNIWFYPPVSIPERKLQHTYTTFVRGLLNPAYFGLHSASEIPELVGTTETPNLPFSCIAVLKKYTEVDMAYKLFSREPMTDELLDLLFSVRKETLRIDWGAYPHYTSPEVFAPFVLDGLHLYYINAFENAASTMETSAVAAENIARLILSKFSGQPPSSSSDLKGSTSVASASDEEGRHFEL
ncbi:PREDICTED: farnesylcysteine lyase [Nelumbo nucifera]|uniref:Farnesylcysteine lyase n=1 Tax=Nelumbo nucifera TaxID=4432 RepID=A0A1U8AQZ3_NELNU|nr:PREDICTED: farnesylcysteine lyase [Nelumbo nucifera]